MAHQQRRSRLAELEALRDWRSQSDSGLMDLVAEAMAQRHPGQGVFPRATVSNEQSLAGTGQPLLLQPSLVPSSSFSLSRDSAMEVRELGTHASIAASTLGPLVPQNDTLLGLPLDSLETLPSELLEAHLLHQMAAAQQQRQQRMQHGFQRSMVGPTSLQGATGCSRGVPGADEMQTIEELQWLLQCQEKKLGHVPAQGFGTAGATRSDHLLQNPNAEVEQLLGSMLPTGAPMSNQGLLKRQPQHHHPHHHLAELGATQGLHRSLKPQAANPSRASILEELVSRDRDSGDGCQQAGDLSRSQLERLTMAAAAQEASFQGGSQLGVPPGEDVLDNQLMGMLSQGMGWPAAGTPTGSFGRCFSEPADNQSSPNSSGGRKKVLSEAEKRLRRLAGNREAAKRMRKRQSERLKIIEVEFAQLKRKHQEVLKELDFAHKKVAQLTDANQKLEKTVSELRSLQD